MKCCAGFSALFMLAYRGILALGYFEPLIVSMIMVTEPLNASVIAMAVVHEEAPARRTVIGVSIVLVGCVIVLWESSTEVKKEEFGMAMATTDRPGTTNSERQMLQQRVFWTQQRRRSTQVV